MPHRTAVTTLSAFAFMAAGLGLLMLATAMWCLTLVSLLAVVAIRRPLRMMARTQP